MRVLVFCEGKHEYGGELDVDCQAGNLPALPCLIDRMLGRPDGATYRCLDIKHLGKLSGKRPPKAKKGGYSKKVAAAMLQAQLDGYDAAIVLIDRDRNSEMLNDLRAGREAGETATTMPCSVGAAVETFDAWMIVDGKAVEQAGGDATRSHPGAELLDGKEGTGNHPKDRAAELFGSGMGLSEKYTTVATVVDLELLRRQCPKGFTPFAEDVEERIGPLVSGRS